MKRFYGFLSSYSAFVIDLSILSKDLIFCLGLLFCAFMGHPLFTGCLVAGPSSESLSSCLLLVR